MSLHHLHEQERLCVSCFIGVINVVQLDLGCRYFDHLGLRLVNHFACVSSTFLSSVVLRLHRAPLFKITLVPVGHQTIWFDSFLKNNIIIFNTNVERCLTMLVQHK